MEFIAYIILLTIIPIAALFLSAPISYVLKSTLTLSADSALFNMIHSSLDAIVMYLLGYVLFEWLGIFTNYGIFIALLLWLTAFAYRQQLIGRPYAMATWIGYSTGLLLCMIFV